MSQNGTPGHVLHDLDNASFDTSPPFRSRCDGAMFTRRRAWKGLVRPSIDDGADNGTGSLFPAGHTLSPPSYKARSARDKAHAMERMAALHKVMNDTEATI